MGLVQKTLFEESRKDLGENLFQRGKVRWYWKKENNFPSLPVFLQFPESFFLLEGTEGEARASQNLGVSEHKKLLLRKEIIGASLAKIVESSEEEERERRLKGVVGRPDSFSCLLPLYLASPPFLQIYSPKSLKFSFTMFRLFSFALFGYFFYFLQINWQIPLTVFCPLEFGPSAAYNFFSSIHVLTAQINAADKG